MKLRAFAAAWTVFTALAAPALLSAAEEPAPVPPAVDPAAQSPPLPEVEPAPAPAPVEPAQSSEPAPAPPAAEQPVTEQPAADPEPAEAETPEKKAKPKPVARAAASASVTISDFEFAPSSVTINVGDTVTWTNQGPTVHTATGSGFDTGNLSKGESGSHTFSSAGTFDYICTPHPFMKGTVTVAAASSGEGSGDDAGSDGAGESASGDDGPSLPDTGADAWALALIGTGLLSLGAAVRRRSHSA